jgi:hypothetical protein
MAKTYRRAVARGSRVSSAETNASRQRKTAGHRPEMHGRNIVDFVDRMPVERITETVRFVHDVLATA